MNFDRNGQPRHRGMLLCTQPDFINGAKNLPSLTGEFGRVAGAKAKQGDSRHKKLLQSKSKKEPSDDYERTAF